MCVYVDECVCVCACVRACVRVYVCECVIEYRLCLFCHITIIDYIKQDSNTDV